MTAQPATAPPAGTPQLPFAGFDRLDAKQAVAELSDHSQVELTAVEAYERANQNRKPVIDKLRFMRQPEPMPGYDALSPAEIDAALGEANLDTLRKVRGYERKFANRPQVLEAIARAHGVRRTTETAVAAPAYEPTQYRKRA